MSVLPEKILVAIEGSDRAARATLTAAELAEKLRLRGAPRALPGARRARGRGVA